LAQFEDMQDSLREYLKEYQELHSSDDMKTDKAIIEYQNELKRVNWEIAQLQKQIDLKK